MPERPLLILPAPQAISAPQSASRFVPPTVRKPDKVRQGARIGPVFDRLQQALSPNVQGVLELRKDPSALSPERVVVFEVAGSIQNFVSAIQRIPGFVFLGEQDADIEPDADFAMVDTRSGRQGEDRLDRAIGGKLYLAMPDLQALRQLLSLWQTWQSGNDLPEGFAPVKAAFQQLRALRPWGPQDRIPDETVAYWLEEVSAHPSQLVRTEVDLWFHPDATKREHAFQQLRRVVEASGGQVVHKAVIPEIHYHGALIDLLPSVVPSLIERQNVDLALADDVMFYRAQSVLRSPSVQLSEETVAEATASLPTELPPIAALFDGVPIAAHALLADRLVLDDPDDLELLAPVQQRRHGTAMASLVVHGDLNDPRGSLSRKVYVRPVLIPDANGGEISRRDVLLVDSIYRAVRRIKGNDDEPGVAPSVFLINLSIGDPRRPFSLLISPLARLLDYLAARYGVLFLVSGGNVAAPLQISDFASWSDYSTADPEERQRATLSALNATKHERSIFSPGESLNALTIGAQHLDNLSARTVGWTTVDPYACEMLPNPSSALGLGPNRAVKPDICLPGGREHVRMVSTGAGVAVAIQESGSLFGLMAAAPDTSGQARIDACALSDGTSSATALATRAAHQVFDALIGLDGFLTDADAGFYAVLVKALMVHRARWGDHADVLKQVCGPRDRGRHVELAENVSRFIGYGVPSIGEAIECSLNRATLVGYGSLNANSGHEYRIPLPSCLEGVKDPRSLTVTLAWFSPVRPHLRNYRAVRVEAEPTSSRAALGVKRTSLQPYDATVRRGTVFHEHYYGEDAVAFLDDGHLSMRVWCKPDAGGDDEFVKYGLAVSIEAGTAIPIYDEIRQRLLVPVRAVSS